MNSIVTSSLTSALVTAVILTASGPSDDIDIHLNSKGAGVVAVGGKLEVVGDSNISGYARFEGGIDVVGGTLKFNGVGPNADTPVEDGDYLIVPGTVITTRNGVIIAVTPP